MFGRTVCKSMVAFLLKSTNKTQKTNPARCSRCDLAKARIVVSGVKTRLRLGRLAPPANDSSGAAVARSWRIDCVLVVVAARLRWQCTFAVSEHRAVLAVRKRPAGKNQTMGVLRFGRQLRQGHGARGECRFRHWLFGLDCNCCQYRPRQCDNQPPLAQGLPPWWPSGEKHGKSLKPEAAMLPNRPRNLKPLPKIGAEPSVR